MHSLDRPKAKGARAFWSYLGLSETTNAENLLDRQTHRCMERAAYVMGPNSRKELALRPGPLQCTRQQRREYTARVFKSSEEAAGMEGLKGGTWG